MTSLQTKRFSEQTQTAGNGEVHDVTPKVRKTTEKRLIHHAFITAFISGTAALTATEHKPGLIHLGVTSFCSFIVIPAEIAKFRREIRGKQFLLEVIDRRRTPQLICNSQENPSER